MLTKRPNSTARSSPQSPLPTMPTIITPTPDELVAGKLDDETLFQALRSFHRDGLLVLDGVMDKGKLDGIRDFLLEEGVDVKNRAVVHKAEEGRPTSASVPRLLR